MTHRQLATLAASALALLAALPARADAPPSLTIVGFSRDSRQVLLRREDGTLALLTRDGRALDPPRASRDLERRYHHGTRLHSRGQRLTGKGVDLRLDRAGRHLVLQRGGRSITLWTAEACGSSADCCAPDRVLQGRLSRSRQVLALVLHRPCRPGGEAVVISLPAVARRLLLQGTTLTRRGKLKPAVAALGSALALQPGSAEVIYRLACVAALRGEQAAAVSWLGRLNDLGTSTARRLLVRARFDRDFRLIKDSAAFRSVVGN